MIKRKKPIRRVSKKRAEDMKKYSALRKQFLAEFPLCYVWWSENAKECPNQAHYGLWCEMIRAGHVNNPCPATEVHHKARRGKNYLNTDTWLAVSRKNHVRLHENPSWARERGYLL